MLSLILQFVPLLRDSEMGGRIAGFLLAFPFQFADLTQASAEWSGPQLEPIALGLVYILHHVGGNSRTAVFAAKSPPTFSRGTSRSAVGKDGGMPPKVNL
jgi:hypothetical protein